MADQPNALPHIHFATPNQVFRDPAVKTEESWRVLFNGRITSPTFANKGAADGYMDLLKAGSRKPEYEGEPPESKQPHLIDAIWQAGQKAMREAASALASLHGDGLNAEELAAAIRALPLTTAPEEAGKIRKAIKSGMERISFEEFQQSVLAADSATPFRTTNVENKTRKGTYWSIVKGLSASSWFVGFALDEGNATIVERVD